MILDSVFLNIAVIWPIEQVCVINMCFCKNKTKTSKPASLVLSASNL